MKDERYVHARTCVYNLNYHIVWSVKYRRKVLNKEITQFLLDDLRKIGKDNGFVVVQANVGENDHVHVFVSAPPKISVTEIMLVLKGTSGRHIMMHFPEIKQYLWKGHLWNGSYYVESIGSTSEENIKRYIERQQRCQQ